MSIEGVRHQITLGRQENKAAAVEIKSADEFGTKLMTACSGALEHLEAARKILSTVGLDTGTHITALLGNAAISEGSAVTLFYAALEGSNNQHAAELMGNGSKTDTKIHKAFNIAGGIQEELNNTRMGIHATIDQIKILGDIVMQCPTPALLVDCDVVDRLAGAVIEDLGGAPA